MYKGLVNFPASFPSYSICLLKDFFISENIMNFILYSSESMNPRNIYVNRAGDFNAAIGGGGERGGGSGIKSAFHDL